MICLMMTGEKMFTIQIQNVLFPGEVKSHRNEKRICIFLFFRLTFLSFFSLLFPVETIPVRKSDWFCKLN